MEFARAARKRRNDGRNGRARSARFARRRRRARTCWSDRCDWCARSAGRRWRDRCYRSAGAARRDGATGSPNQFWRDVVQQHHLQHGKRCFLQWLRLHLVSKFQHEQSAGYIAYPVGRARATRINRCHGCNRCDRPARATRIDRTARINGGYRRDWRHGCNWRSGNTWGNGSARAARRDRPTRTAGQFSGNVVGRRHIQHGRRRLLQRFRLYFVSKFQYEQSAEYIADAMGRARAAGRSGCHRRDRSNWCARATRSDRCAGLCGAYRSDWRDRRHWSTGFARYDWFARSTADVRRNLGQRHYIFFGPGGLLQRLDVYFPRKQQHRQ
jgi:hypothetical protein